MAASTNFQEDEVDLGFVAKTESWKLLSHFFASKVGGKPSWLSLKPLPTIEELKCKKCGKLCSFLLQIYAPDTTKESLFHRTLFVFVCRESPCSKNNDNSNFLVFRSQLPRENQFYSSEPPDDRYFDARSDYPKAEKYQSMCELCGCVGPSKCAKCNTTYCCKEHQAIHWKGGHSNTCGTEKANSVSSKTQKKITFPEYELEVDKENYKEANKEKSESEALKEYQKFMKSERGQNCLLGQALEKDLESMSLSDKSDKQFKKFKKRIDHEPEQVLRYDKGGQPLWVSAECQPSCNDVPRCSCGSKRQFEFQILPQMLNHLDLDHLKDTLDWGTLAVYTCMDNCEINSTYKGEFLWKQDYAE